eukprot:GHVO01058521.1.p2 GENE.GHVO01058521.1~~GHVO01058521.1.p2  ORF type:complete len:100 (-),score=0.75 GHVO01058521.1:106-405(-)
MDLYSNVLYIPVVQLVQLRQERQLVAAEGLYWADQHHLCMLGSSCHEDSPPCCPYCSHSRIYLYNHNAYNLIRGSVFDLYLCKPKLQLRNHRGTQGRQR